MSYETVLFERRGRVALITINRPQAMNSVNAKLWSELGLVLEEFNNDSDLWVAILTGKGERAFCAGADLKDVAAGKSVVPEDGEKWGFAGIVKHYVKKPIIAAVNGFAVGGGTEIALACDLIVASEKATFGLPEVKRGIIAGGGGLLRLPRQIPLKIAMEFILTGDTFSSEEAKSWGLVNHIVPQENLIDEAFALAEKIAENAPLAVSTSKDIIYRGLDVPLEHPQEAWTINDGYVKEVRTWEDRLEGARAFAEKRKPQWLGK